MWLLQVEVYIYRRSVFGKSSGWYCHFKNMLLRRFSSGVECCCECNDDWRMGFLSMLFAASINSLCICIGLCPRWTRQVKKDRVMKMKSCIFVF